MNLKRDLKAANIPLAVVTIPSGGRMELSEVCKIADQASRTFFAQHGIPGVQIKGGWHWQQCVYEDPAQRATKGKYPVVVYIAQIRGTSSEQARCQEIVELFSEMIQYLVTRIQVDFNAAPMTLFINDNEFSLTKQPAAVPA